MAETPGDLKSVPAQAIDALKAQPMLLVIVLLNLIFAVIAGYYLLAVEGYRADDRKALIALFEKCFTK